MSNAAAARVLGSLLGIPPAALESFAATAISKESPLTPKELQAVRDIMERLGEAMLADEYEPARWARIHEIREQLLAPLPETEAVAAPPARPAPPAPPPLKQKSPADSAPPAPKVDPSGERDAREMPSVALAASPPPPPARPRFSVPSKRSAPVSPWSRAPLDDEDLTALTPMPSAAARGAELPTGWTRGKSNEGAVSPAKSEGRGLPREWSQPPTPRPAAGEAPPRDADPPRPRWNPYEHPIDETVDAPAPPPPRDEAPLDEADDPLMRTVTSVVKREEAEALALPFREHGTPRQMVGSALPKPSPPRARRPTPSDASDRRGAAGDERDPMAQTMTSLSELNAAAALPFAALPDPRSKPPAPPPRKHPSKPPPRSDRRLESTPPRSAPPSAPRSTADEEAAHPALAQYAALCAGCRVHPVRRASLNAQYGLRDDSERRELDARWRDHFALHPGEYTLFKRLVAEYQDWLIRQPE